MKNLELLTEKDVRIIVDEMLKEKIRPDFMTLRQTADLLGVTPQTIKNYTKSGILKQYRIGPGIRYKYSEVIKSIKPTN